MPEPVVAHVIGTVVLLSVALLTVASVTIVQQANYVQTLNAMLAEVAESCARQIVELVSIHTIGGGDYTYMELTLPQSLGGQPYNITLVNLGENMLIVIAQLQLHRQVRIVVTPNFGQAPIYVASTVTKFGDLIISPTILFPLPPDRKASLVAVRSGDFILVGFTNQPPVKLEGAPPSCRFLDWTKEVVAPVSSTIALNFTIYNRGDNPSWMVVEVVDNEGRKKGERLFYVLDGGLGSGSIYVELPASVGIYGWSLTCTAETGEPSSVNVVVETLKPSIEVIEASTLLRGEAGSITYVYVTVKNTGKVQGTVRIRLRYFEKDVFEEGVLQPGGTKRFSFEVQLPSSPGSYSAVLEVDVVETSETEYNIPITITVYGDDPYIASINSTIIGLPGWQPKLYVAIENPKDVPVEVDITVDGNVLARVSVPAKGSRLTIVRPTLPSARGIYTWQISLLKDGKTVSKANVLVEVRDVKEVKRNVILADRGPFTLKDEERVCGKRYQGGGTRCVTLLTIPLNLGDYPAYGFWVAVRVYLSTSGNVYRGIGLRGSGKLYEASANGRGSNAEIFLCSLDETGKQWDQPTISDTGRILNVGYYPLHLFTRCDGVLCSLRAFLYLPSPLHIQGSFRGGMPSSLALLVDEGTGTFSDIVITRRDSRFLFVEGLPPGWTVELWDGSELIASSSDGMLFVALRYMISNARLRFIDPYNEAFPYERSIGGLYGGDTIILSSEP